MSETCETCIWNDDGLCDQKGYVIACKLYDTQKETDK